LQKHFTYFIKLFPTESLQNSVDNLKQENRVLAEEAEGAQSAEWLRHVNDRLRTSELKVRVYHACPGLF